MGGCLDLDVLFSRVGEGFQAVITRSPAGEGQCAVFGRPLSDLELENLVLRVGRFRSRTRRAETAPVAAAKAAGGRLFEAVFSGAAGECLRRSLDVARAQDGVLRIRLRLSGCPELSDLPWELLYDRGDDWFLALSGRTPVVRYVQLPDPPRPVAAVLPLRVLVIRSEPCDYPALDLAAEWVQVEAALGDLTGAGVVAVTVLGAATLGELRRALLRERFHVLHFMGHGGFDAEQGGVLMFTGPSGRGMPVTSSDLGVMLRDHTSLRLVVLNACEAGRTDPADPFAGVADTLVRRGIPAVIAMQFEVSDEAAVEFAPALYGALAAGLPVDMAVAEARKAVYAVSPLEWATPVLYLRADDALLFDITHSAATGPAGTAAAPARPDSRLLDGARHADEGERLLDSRRYDDAAAAYRAALTADPQMARAHTGLGRALGGLKQRPEAEAAFREAIRLDPGDALAHSGLGAILRQVKQYAEAEAACREAIRLDPGLAPAHINLCSVLCAVGRYAEAEAACREAIRLDPGLAMAHNNLGKVLWDLKRYAEAEAAFREAIRLEPGLALAHNGHGSALRAVGRIADAEAAFREAIRLDPGLAMAHNNLGKVLWDLKRYAEAEAAFREAIRLEPGLALAQDNLTALLEALKRRR